MEKATLRRENGNVNIAGFPVPFNGRWVARDSKGHYLDHDKYRHDLSDRLSNKYEVEIIGD